MLQIIIRVFHTVRYLRIKQVLFRFLSKLKSPIVEKYPGLTVKYNHWRFSSPLPFTQSMFDDGSVSFLSKRVSVGTKLIWNDTTQTKLWLYNLHYFDDLNSHGFKSRNILHHHMISRWIDENPPCLGNGWEPYPLSLRLVNWVKWLSKQDNVNQTYLISMVEQASALSQQLEYHILGNHLFANAKALIFVGCFLEPSDNINFLNLGLKILDKEINEQFLDDGAHFELSPMYHQILLWDLLDLINLGQITKNVEVSKRLPCWNKVAKKALFWLKTMLHPDQEITFFNDAAQGIAAKPQVIFTYAEQLGIEFDSEISDVTTHKISGYTRIQMSNHTLFIDHANVGPDYLPGHAHADTLSFELSIGIHRVFVNSGTSLYGTSAERLRQRQTSAHNTVSVEGLDSSQVWSGFRVAKRAYSKLIESSVSKGVATIEASHDGYLKQSPKVTHTRKFDCSDSSILISDKLSIPRSATYNLHIHPRLNVLQVSNNKLSLSLNDNILCYFESPEPIRITDSTWHPEFGKSIPNKKIEIDFASGILDTRISITENTL